MLHSGYRHGPLNGCMTNRNYLGMTLNERLFAAGVLDAFDTAISERNREKVIELLSAVEIEQPYAIANSLLGLNYQCRFCGAGIEQDGRQAPMALERDVQFPMDDEN